MEVVAGKPATATEISQWERVSRYPRTDHRYYWSAVRIYLYNKYCGQTIDISYIYREVYPLTNCV